MICRLCVLSVKLVRQSSTIFGVLLFAFIVYITIRNQLPLYLNLFSKGESTASNEVAASDSVNKMFGDSLKIIPDFLKPGVNKLLNDAMSNAGYA